MRHNLDHGEILMVLELGRGFGSFHHTLNFNHGEIVIVFEISIRLLSIFFYQKEILLTNNLIEKNLSPLHNIISVIFFSLFHPRI